MGSAWSACICASSSLIWYAISAWRWVRLTEADTNGPTVIEADTGVSAGANGDDAIVATRQYASRVPGTNATYGRTICPSLRIALGYTPPQAVCGRQKAGPGEHAPSSPPCLIRWVGADIDGQKKQLRARRCHSRRRAAASRRRPLRASEPAATAGGSRCSCRR